MRLKHLTLNSVKPGIILFTLFSFILAESDSTLECRTYTVFDTYSDIKTSTDTRTVTKSETYTSVNPTVYTTHDTLTETRIVNNTTTFKETYINAVISTSTMHYCDLTTQLACDNTQYITNTVYCTVTMKPFSSCKKFDKLSTVKIIDEDLTNLKKYSNSDREYFRSANVKIKQQKTSDMCTNKRNKKKKKQDCLHKLFDHCS